MNYDQTNNFKQKVWMHRVEQEIALRYNRNIRKREVVMLIPDANFLKIKC